MRYDFPGNVRELENILERALALSPGEELGPERFHPTVGTAVDAYVAETGVQWRESDEEPDPQPGR